MRVVQPIVEWDIVVLGGLNADYLIRGRQLPGPGVSLNGDVFLEAPGGKGANAAVAAARLAPFPSSLTPRHRCRCQASS
jgi:hypothetical protein